MKNLFENFPVTFQGFFFFLTTLSCCYFNNSYHFWFFRFIECCDKLDVCYGSCLEEKGLCDQKLLRCVTNVCKTTENNQIADVCMPLLTLKSNRKFMKSLIKGYELFSCQVW